MGKAAEYQQWLDGDASVTMKRKEFLALYQGIAATPLMSRDHFQTVDAEEAGNLASAITQIENALDLPYKDDRG